MTIERTLHKAKLEFDVQVKMLEFMLAVGSISLADKPVEVRVTYKKQILFDSMDKLSFGTFNIDLDSLNELPIKEQEKSLNQLALKILDQ